MEYSISKGLSVHVGSVPRWRTRVGDIPPVPAVEGRFPFQRVKSIIVFHLATLFSDSTLPLPLMCCSVNVLRCVPYISVSLAMILQSLQKRHLFLSLVLRELMRY